MVDFVLTGKYTATGHENYANFLKQPLEIWMFIPCKLVDGVWVVLEITINNSRELNSQFQDKKLQKKFELNFNEYQEAKERCLFEGWIVENKSIFTIWIENKTANICFTVRGKVNYNGINIQTIEDLVIYNLQLTPTAQKQLSL